MKTWKIISIVAFSITLILCICISCNALTNDEVTQRMNNLKSIYPDGKYWNHNPNNSNDPASVTDSPCTHHGIINCSYYGTCGCNSFGAAIQCHGFAKYMANLTFNSFPNVTTSTTSYTDKAGWNLYLNGSSEYSHITLEPGDLIRCSGHTAIVWKVTNNMVYVAEVWGGVNCDINWDRYNCGCGVNTITVNQIKNHATYIVKAPKTGPTSYTITYNGNGGRLTTSSSNVTIGQAFTLTQIPVYNGYTFLGWSTSADPSSVQYEPNSQIVLASDIILYAVWGVNITYMDAGNNNILNTSVQIKDRSFTIPDISVSNFDIEGWNTTTGIYNTFTYSKNATVLFNQDTTLYAVQTYTVTYNGNTGIPIKANDILYYNEPLTTLPYATREGYKFIGWYTFDNQKVYPSSINKTAGHITLYAHWQDGNKIYFDSNGGTCDMKIIYCNYNEEIGTLPLPVKEGYKFDGWWFTYPGTENSQRITSNTLLPVDYDIILSAKWETGAKVYFITDGGECNELYRFVLPGNTIGNLPQPTKEGYTFNGWYLNDSFTGVPISSAYLITSDTDFALFAKWTEN